MKRNALCPCGSGNKYCDCCQKYHRGILPESALQLMRSRYSAYALGLEDYIIQTTHPLNPRYNLESSIQKKEIRRFIDHTLFENLKIIAFEEGKEIAYVTFKAFLKQNGKDASFIEKSRFLFIAGKWLYVDGVFL